MGDRYDAIILGGGFAGLSCAVRLADAGKKVVVLDKKPHLGGRAYSFKDAETGDTVDNGQHLFMGCYRETRAFLAKIGTADKLRFLEKIRVDFADAAGGRDALSCPAWLGSPLHLAAGVLGLKGVSWGDKLGLSRLDAALRAVLRGPVPAALDNVTVRQWMDSLGQSRRIQERLFDPIAIGALNDSPDVAAATGMVQVLREAFYRDVESSRLGLSTVGLSELYTDAAKTFIESRGGVVRLNAKAKSIESGRILLEDGSALAAGMVVSTLPPWELKKLSRPDAFKGPWDELAAAPIVSLTLWLDRPIIAENFVGLLGTEIQWVFNKSKIHSLPGGGQCVALVISGAHKHVGSDPKALFELAKADLSKCLPEFRKAIISRWKVVKEPFATLSPAPGSDARRAPVGVVAPGLALAGDWTRTGLPATIESAVKSGREAAESVLNGGAHA